MASNSDCLLNLLAWPPGISNIKIKPVDEDGVIVIINKIYYIEECNRQLQNKDYYERLQEYATNHFN